MEVIYCKTRGELFIKFVSTAPNSLSFICLLSISLPIRVFFFFPQREPLFFCRPPSFPVFCQFFGVLSFSFLVAVTRLYKLFLGSLVRRLILFAVLLFFFSRVLRDSTPCFVSRSDTLYCLLCIIILWPYCSYPIALVSSNIAPAHPHTTGVAVYPALFQKSVTVRNLRRDVLVPKLYRETKTTSLVWSLDYLYVCISICLYIYLFV